MQVQVISTVPVMFSYWAKANQALELHQALNDHMAQACRDNPRHYAGIGTVPLQSPRLAVQELERCMDQLGLQGCQIGSHVNDWNLDAPELFEFFEAAADLGAAILVHPWDMMGTPSMPKYWLPWLVGMPAEQSRAACCLVFGGVLERLPKLKICLAHGGGSFPTPSAASNTASTCARIWSRPTIRAIHAITCRSSTSIPGSPIRAPCNTCSIPAACRG
ncbi:amidohydrolase family protein [Lysobacter gummosus]|uniref:amidohydrolase family protein n=1 Tax=Lysobacter gummosus TaxID=262324 RepID=UPI00363EF066